LSQKTVPPDLIDVVMERIPVTTATGKRTIDGGRLCGISQNTPGTVAKPFVNIKCQSTIAR
jgi:hypothetical protein